MEFSGVGFAADGKIEGVGTFAGGVYGDLKINGVCTINGDLEVDSLDVDGVCTINGNLTAKVFDCDGVLTIKGNLRSGTIDIDGVVSVDGNKAEADRIECDGILSVKGEISADEIVSDGRLYAEEIVGDSITINSHWKSGIRRVLFRFGENIGGAIMGLAGKDNSKLSVIGLIEGTTVELKGVRAKSVSGQDVTIGKNCEIERVEASGMLSIHPSSRVGEAVG
jgi:cytoskeletal protein CcmA (bactofilin family)